MEGFHNLGERDPFLLAIQDWYEVVFLSKPEAPAKDSSSCPYSTPKTSLHT
jgi:hypothetical protein